MSQIIASTYELIEKLGSGGGGMVYLAQHLRLEKKVVLKADKRRLSTRQDLLRREVDILKELSHPHIPQVYDFFVEGENVYTVMAYIEGESLDKPLKRGERFSQAQVVGWAVQILDALCYLHSPTHGDPPKGFVHSDIKPANLMRMPNGRISLIDFNIALALGEENVIGCSAGYASPEHYGLDFSSKYESSSKYGPSSGYEASLNEEKEPPSEDDILTVTIAGPSDVQASGTPGISRSSSSSNSSRRRQAAPDVRSDIYSVGATLYHLLSGTRASRHAKEVVRLSDEKFSPQIVQIISKAMDPNPDLRYQTADQMRQAFLDLRKTDPRMVRWRKHRRRAAIVFPLLFLIGGLTAFAGLKRMQSMERWLKLAEYARTSLEEGDVEGAAAYALQIWSESTEQMIPEYVPGVQKVLTDALGVYNVSDGYKADKIIEFPSAPHYMALSPDGRNAAALCGKKVVVFDTSDARVTAELPAGDSAISELRYLDNRTLLYAGEDGMKAYDTEKKQELWTGKAASSICTSGDGKMAAGILEGETFATVYDARTGKEKCKVDFAGKSQSIGIKDNLFALNQEGSLLGVSFQDGSLQIYNLETLAYHPETPEKEMVVLRSDSGYQHFEGGFSGKYLAFAASGTEKSTFAVIDAEKGEEVGGFQSSEAAFGVQVDVGGIYVQSDHILVKVDPATGEQTPWAAADGNILHFATDGAHTVATSEDEMYFFNEDAQMLSYYKKEYTSDLLRIAGGTAVIASMDRPAARILRYESGAETEILSYEPDYRHDEARVSMDGSTWMLFSYDRFRIYGKDGIVVKDAELPDPDQVIDQQFVREERESCLEVRYDTGKVDVYSAKDGRLLRQVTEEAKGGLDEEFIVGGLRIESPLHGTPTVYDAKTGREVARLKEDTYLTYVTKVNDYIVTQYTTADGRHSGQLLNGRCEAVAELPYLCDVVGERLFFDLPTGCIRESRIYGMEELVDLAGREAGPDK